MCYYNFINRKGTNSNGQKYQYFNQKQQEPRKIVNVQTQEFFNKQIANTTITILKNTTAYIKNSFCVTLTYITEYDSTIEKSLIEILTRISNKTLDYCTKDKLFKKNKTFFLHVKNHKSIMKVETPSFDPLHRDTILVTIIGINHF